MYNLFDSYCQGIRGAVSQDAVYRGTQQNFAVPPATQLFANVACSYQEASARVASYYAQRNRDVDGEVIFGQQITIEPNDLIVLVRAATGDTLNLLVQGEVDPIQQGFMWTWKVPVKRVVLPGTNNTD